MIGKAGAQEGWRAHEIEREGGCIRGKAGTREGRWVQEREGRCMRRVGARTAPAAAIAPAPVGAPGWWWRQ